MLAVADRVIFLPVHEWIASVEEATHPGGGGTVSQGTPNLRESRKLIQQEQVRRLRGGKGSVLIILHAVVIRPLTSHLYRARAEPVGAAAGSGSQSPGAKRRNVPGESNLNPAEVVRPSTGYLAYG